MAIAQMNWGRMLAPLDAPEMAEFNAALAGVYDLAERHDGFIWRIPDDVAGDELAALGHDDRMSATVSVWRDIDALWAFTFQTAHGRFLDQRAQWFVPVEGPQLVFWDVDEEARPGFAEAFRRLEHLKANGPGPEAYGWPERLRTA